MPGALNDKQKEFLSEVYKGNRRMVELVNALLNVSRMELGTFVVEPEPTDVVALTRSVVDEQNCRLKRKNKIGENMLKICPCSMLIQNFAHGIQNLLSNAVKYTPDKGKVGLDIRVTKRR